MSRSLFIRPDALADIEDARRSFEQIRLGLGDRFVDRVEALLNLVEPMPELFGRVWADVRAARVNRFRHVLYDLVFPDRVKVLAVMHGARDPSAWQARV